MKNCILSIFLIIVLALSCVAFAEENTISLTDSTLYVGNKTYTFPISIADLTELGVDIPDVSNLTAGVYYPGVDVNDGRNGFAIRIEYLSNLEDPIWATGVNLNSDNHAGMSVGGMVLGETTRGEIIAACGGDNYGNTYEGDSLTYYAYNINYIWYLSFDGTAEDSKLTRVSMHNELTEKYGEVDASNAGVKDNDLPDTSAMGFNEFILDGKYYAKNSTVQDLLDNGWVLTFDDAEKSVAAKDGLIMAGGSLWLYNGVSMVRINAFNTNEAEGEYGYADCTINSVYADVCNNATIVCADGLTNMGSTYDDAVAILGEPTSIEENETGFRDVSFTVLNNVKYTIGVNTDGSITYITITNLI